MINKNDGYKIKKVHRYNLTLFVFPYRYKFSYYDFFVPYDINVRFWQNK